VTDFKLFSDTGLTTALTYDELISSGFNTASTEAEVGPQLAVDDDLSTAWRPALASGTTQQTGEAWIGMRFNTRTAVKGATAVGLGLGEGGGNSWNGGITLQSSEDGVTWTTVATSWDSDSVTAEEATSPAYILPEEAGIACPFGYDHVTTDAECRAGGVEVGATPPNESYDNRGNDACGVCLADGNSCCNEDWVTLNGWASGNGCYRPVCAVAPPM